MEKLQVDIDEERRSQLIEESMCNQMGLAFMRLGLKSVMVEIPENGRKTGRGYRRARLFQGFPLVVFSRRWLVS